MQHKSRVVPKIRGEEFVREPPNPETVMECPEPVLKDLWRSKLLGYEAHGRVLSLGSAKLAELKTRSHERVDERFIVDAIARKDNVQGGFTNDVGKGGRGIELPV